MATPAAPRPRARRGSPAPAPDPGPRLPARRWPRADATVVAAVAAGGFLGGLARYAVTRAWPTPPGAVPWAVVGLNTGGAFLLGLILVLVAEVLPPTRYLRALVGTGFCGAFTTFSTVVVGVDQLAAHGHPAVAVGYLAVSVLAGLAAASLGVLLARSVAAGRHRERSRRRG